MGIHFKITSRFYYSKLNQNEKRIYERIVGAWLNYEETVVVLGALQCDFRTIFDAINYDYPELFYVDFSKVLITRALAASHIHASFLYSKDECERTKELIKKKVSQIVTNSTSTDRERTIHDYLVDGIKYAYTVYDDAVYSIKAPFINGYAVCEGYAKAFKLLCDEANIPCIIVVGTAFSPKNNLENHAWNIIHLKTGNYNVDTTWNRCIGGPFAPYYNASDELFSWDHRWNTSFYPKCNRPNSFEKAIVEISDERQLNNMLVPFCTNPNGKQIIRITYAINPNQNPVDMITQKIVALKPSRPIQTHYIPGIKCFILNPIYI